MATYQGIKGLRVKYLSADPSNLTAGNVWYNSTTDTLRTLVASEAWASASPMTNVRVQGAMAGTATAGLYFGGGEPPNTSETEEFNGTGWYSGGAMNTGRADLGGAGVQTAAVAFGGQNPGFLTATEEYDGSAWATIPAGTLPVAKVGMGYGGIQTAALSAAGAPPSNPTGATTSEEYNGATWTAGGTMATGRRDLAKGVTGTQTAGLAVAGRIAGTSTDAIEEYNGTGWSTVTSYPVACRAGGAAGTQTSALVCGGQTSSGVSPTNQTLTNSYDGSAWTTTPSLGTAIYMNASGGADATSVITSGGWQPATTANTEEFTRSTNVITAASWAAGGNLNTGRNHSSGLGATMDTALIVQGGDASRSTASESYDGSSWTTTNSALTAATTGAGTGTLTAGIVIEGSTAPTTFVTGVEEWDGTNWSAGTATGASHYSGILFGQSQTSAVAAGGQASWPNSPSSTTEIWNGTSWTTAPGAYKPSAMAYEQGIMCGTETAGLAGNYYPAGELVTDEFDGATWTASGSTVVKHNNASSFGSQTDAMVGGGANGPPGTTTSAEGYDGTAWSTRPSLANTSKGGNRGSTSNTTTGGLAAGVNPGPHLPTEEYNGETTTATAATLTTS